MYSVIFNCMNTQILKSYIRTLLENLEDDVEDQIDELCSTPEYKSVNDFLEYKLNNEEYEFNFIELQALARNETKARTGDKRTSAASQKETESIKDVLVRDYGFEFIPREKLKQTRGFTSPLNGKSRWAGQGGGGSGFGSDFGGSTFTSFGGGAGAMGGGGTWDKNSSRNLGMGAGRKLFRTAPRTTTADLEQTIPAF